MMYGKNYWRDSLKVQFEAKYPSVATMLIGLKEHDYAHAARLMQNIESTIFIHHICCRIMRERPGVLNSLARFWDE